jgi:hypothetical protein
MTETMKILVGLMKMVKYKKVEEILNKQLKNLVKAEVLLITLVF